MKPTTPLEIAQALVRIPSVNPNYDPASRAEQDVVPWIQSWGQEHGFETRTQPVLDDRANVILRLRNGADHPHLLFNGHTDTVAVAGMTIPPFAGDVREGRLWGRGSTDMKGPLACMLAAAWQLRQQPATWRGTLTVACVVDEEYRFRGIRALMEALVPSPQGSERRAPARPVGVTERQLAEAALGAPDFAVVGEPTSLRVVRGCKGCLRFTIRAHGQAAHSAHPERGRSAIVAMARAILELETFFHERLAQIRLPDFGCSTGSMGLIEGGSGINIVPAECAIQVDVRLLPGQDAGQTHREIETHLRERMNPVKDIEWSFDPPGLIDPPYEVPANSDLVRQACAALGRPKSEVVFYACDASKIAAKNVPCIILGPGDIAAAHTADESIAVDELSAGAEAYVRLAQKLMPPNP